MSETFPETEESTIHVTEDASTAQYLTFSLGEESFGIPIGHVIEIVGMQSITNVPHVPSYVKGVINLRGQVIPVMDVRLRFHMPELDYHSRTCIIVVRVQDSDIGLIVDVVQEVITISVAEVEPPPQLGAGRVTQFIEGIAKIQGDVKMILDVPQLLFR